MRIRKILLVFEIGIEKIPGIELILRYSTKREVPTAGVLTTYFRISDFFFIKKSGPGF